MEALLRELERQLEQKTPAERGRAAEAVRSLLAGVRGVGAHLELPMGVVLRAVGAIGRAHAMRKPAGTVLQEARALAQKVGPHVAALFQAV